MSQFKSDTFIFDGVSSDLYGLKIVNVENDGFKSMFGTDRGIDEDDNFGNIPIFYGIRESCPEFQIELTRVDVNLNVLPINDSDLRIIGKWLFKKEYKPLEVNGLVYYVIFTKGTRWDNGSNMGYLNLTIRMSSPYAYTPIMNSYHTIKGVKKIDLDNISSYDEDIYPDVEFELFEDGDFKITNMTTKEIFEFKDLLKGSKINCYNEGLKQLIDKEKTNDNLMSKFNKKWIRLVSGKNKIKIESKNAKVRIVYQSKMNLY